MPCKKKKTTKTTCHNIIHRHEHGMFREKITNRWLASGSSMGLGFRAMPTKMIRITVLGPELGIPRNKNLWTTGWLLNHGAI